MLGAQQSLLKFLGSKQCLRACFCYLTKTRYSINLDDETVVSQVQCPECVTCFVPDNTNRLDIGPYDTPELMFIVSQLNYRDINIAKFYWVWKQFPREIKYAIAFKLPCCIFVYYWVRIREYDFDSLTAAQLDMVLGNLKNHTASMLLQIEYVESQQAVPPPQKTKPVKKGRAMEQLRELIIGSVTPKPPTEIAPPPLLQPKPQRSHLAHQCHRRVVCAALGSDIYENGIDTTAG